MGFLTCCRNDNRYTLLKVVKLFCIAKVNLFKIHLCPPRLRFCEVDYRKVAYFFDQKVKFFVRKVKFLFQKI